jgi:hypothetical protein
VDLLGVHDQFLASSQRRAAKKIIHQLASLYACPTARNISGIGEWILVKFDIGMISSTAVTHYSSNGYFT